MYASNCGGVSGDDDDEWMLSQVGGCEDSGSESGEPTAVKFVSEAVNVMLHFIASSSARVGVHCKDTGAEKSKPGKTEGDTEKGVTCMYMCMCVSVCVKWLMIL